MIQASSSGGKHVDGGVYLQYHDTGYDLNPTLLAYCIRSADFSGVSIHFGTSVRQQRIEVLSVEYGVLHQTGLVDGKISNIGIRNGAKPRDLAAGGHRYV